MMVLEFVSCGSIHVFFIPFVRSQKLTFIFQLASDMRRGIFFRGSRNNLLGDIIFIYINYMMNDSAKE